MSLYFILLCTLLLVRPTYGAELCKKISSCSCSMSDGVIDLSPLAKDDGSPAFQDLQDSIGVYKYSWNPCKPFTEGSDCTNVASCQVGQQNAKLGTQDSALFINDLTDGLTIQYSNGARTVYVALKCDRQGKDTLDVKGEDPPHSQSYYMTLHSIHACPGTPTENGEPMSVVLIVIIVIFAVVIVYFIGGMAFQKFVRKESGALLIPNYTFWSAAVGLIHTGCLFVFCCGKRDEKTYSQIN